MNELWRYRFSPPSPSRTHWLCSSSFWSYVHIKLEQLQLQEEYKDTFSLKTQGNYAKSFLAMWSVIILKTFYPDGIDFPFLLCLHESHLDPSRKKKIEWKEMTGNLILKMSIKKGIPNDGRPGGVRIRGFWETKRIMVVEDENRERSWRRGKLPRGWGHGDQALAPKLRKKFENLVEWAE